MSALRLLSKFSLSAHWLLTYSLLIVWRFEPEWWIFTALDNLSPDRQTDRHTLWLLGLLDGAKKLAREFLKHLFFCLILMLIWSFAHWNLYVYSINLFIMIMWWYTALYNCCCSCCSCCDHCCCCVTGVWLRTDDPMLLTTTKRSHTLTAVV